MDTLHAIYLAILQGLTEFLPISSSGHLVLVPSILGWKDQGLAFDVAVHIGSLIAVMMYFRHELTRMSIDWLNSCKQGQTVGDSRLAWAIVWGSIPVALAGLSFNTVIEEESFEDAAMESFRHFVNSKESQQIERAEAVTLN